MVKILYRVVVKPGRIESFEKLVYEIMIPEAKKMHGCRLITLYQNPTNIREYLFYELWDQPQDVSLYKQKIVNIIGSTRPGEEFPAKFNDLLEEDEDLI